MIGRTLSHYQILQELGSGGMGVVYLAKDTQLGRTVALKILPPLVSPNQDRMRRFMREARTASAISHSNVAHIYEIGEADGIHFIAMEYVEGKTLADAIGGQPLAIPDVLDIAIQITDAVEEAHAKGITHRDLKTKNIMITPRNQAKVLDFGLAKLFRPEEEMPETEWTTMTATQPGAVMGTAPYMSPEQALGRQVDHRTDIFSLGVILYEMATGTLPFQGSNANEVIGKILHTQPAPATGINPEISAELDRIIRKCLEKDRQQRYQKAQELLSDLRNLKRGTTSTQVFSVRPTISQRIRAVHVALLVLFFGLLTAVWRWQPWQEKSVQKSELRLISTFPGSHQAASFSPDGSMIAFVNTVGGNSRIWVKNLAQGDPIAVTPENMKASRPRWSPKNDQIIFCVGSFEVSRESEAIWTVAPLGGAPRKIIDPGRNPNWSWDGNRLVYEKNDEIWTANADGSDQHKVEGVPTVPLLLADRYPAFSPDGSEIAFFQSQAGPAGDYWVVSTVSGKGRRLTFDAERGGAPVWTPDGHFLVLSSDRSGSQTLWKVPVSGGTPQPVTTGAGSDADPEISRDGRGLIFTNTRNTHILKLLDDVTGTERELLDSKENIVAPVFSPDGRSLAFFSNSATRTYLCTVTIQEAQVNRVTQKGTEYFPRWSFDGRALYFYDLGPPQSFRKIAATGGQSTEIIPNWVWEAQYGTQMDPTEKYVVYARRSKGSITGTYIRELKTGAEKKLPVSLDDPRWSRDGKSILGYDSKSNILVCASSGGNCSIITKGINPVWSGNESRIYFQRKGKLDDGAELWVAQVDGSQEKKIAELRPMLPIQFFYDVSATDQIAWIQFHPGNSELWLLEQVP